MVKILYFLLFFIFSILTHFDGISFFALYTFYIIYLNNQSIKRTRRLKYKKNRKNKFVFKISNTKKKNKINKKFRKNQIRKLIENLKILDNFKINDDEIEKYCNYYIYNNNLKINNENLGEIERARGKVCPKCGPNETHVRSSNKLCPEYKNKKDNRNNNDDILNEDTLEPYLAKRIRIGEYSLFYNLSMKFIFNFLNSLNKIFKKTPHCHQM
jgi:hypothetical protein